MYTCYNIHKALTHQKRVYGSTCPYLLCEKSVHPTFFFFFYIELLHHRNFKVPMLLMAGKVASWEG